MKTFEVSRRVTSIISIWLGRAALIPVICCLVLMAPRAGAQEVVIERLDLIASTKVSDKDRGFDEPSGLALGSAEGGLLSVSDNSAVLYLLGRDGKLLRDAALTGLGGKDLKGKDLEGIALRPDGSVLMVQERKRRLVLLEGGDTLRLTSIPIEGLTGYPAIAPLLQDNPWNKGPEGVTVDPASGTVFVVYEGQPRLLLHISPNLKAILKATLLTAQMGFTSPHANDTALDVSGLAWSQADGRLWILSDTGKRIFVFDPDDDTAQAIDLAYEDDGKTKWIKDAEGIALDPVQKRLFVISDNGKKSRLYEFQSPDFAR